ncbi:MAG: VCBS repeat-containing protein [Isosphaeraceae bacterium]|nr:VCBS repeat-containing protein [Isosphaeraceae bacterium]
MPSSRPWLAIATIFVACGSLSAQDQDRGAAWTRHVIDDSSRGADGVRLTDINGDGWPDFVTGWEEGGVIRAYLNPGPSAAKRRWPAVTVGRGGSPEDAVYADLDGDGAADVISCCEGQTRSLFVHWAPKEKTRWLDPSAWVTEPIPVTQGARSWMFCLPMQVDGRGGIDLVVGSKNRDAWIGWLEAPSEPHDLASWRWHPLCQAGWIMSLIALDVDGDGDQDIVASDRKGPGRGCFWLENPGPGPEQARPWRKHPVGAEDVEVMFLTLADLDRDGHLDLLTATRDRGLVFLRRQANRSDAWERYTIDLPPNTGTAKAVAVGDIDLDGHPDIIFTCEGAVGSKSGVVWMSYRGSVTDRTWTAHEVSGPEGTKYDLVELLDLDGDGDLDALTCEERENLGVIWYENPALR